MLESTRRQVFALHAEKISKRGISRITGLSRPSVDRILKAGRALLAEPMPAQMRAPELGPFVPVDPSDSTGLIKQLIAELHAQIHADKAAGLRGTPLSSAVATLEKLTKTLKQLEASERKASETIAVSAEEFDLACADLDKKIKAHVARQGELYCCDCGRPLSVAI